MFTNVEYDPPPPFKNLLGIPSALFFAGTVLRPLRCKWGGGGAEEGGGGWVRGYLEVFSQGPPFSQARNLRRSSLRQLRRIEKRTIFKTKLEEKGPGIKCVYMWIYVLHNCKFCLFYAIVFLVLTKFLKRRLKKYFLWWQPQKFKYFKFWYIEMCIRFLFVNSREKMNFHYTDAVRYRGQIHSLWLGGIKLTMAYRCRTGPSGYIGWGGQYDNPMP